jgi:hypothetical protein
MANGISQRIIAHGDALKMKRFERQIRAAADALRPGHTTAEALWHAMAQVDPHGELGFYRQFPVLGDGHWQRRWRELRAEVGRQHALDWVDTPPPPERDYLAFSARHAHWSRVTGRPLPV